MVLNRNELCQNRHRENGQATVEFALLTPLLLGMLFGIIEFGWIFFNIAMISNITRTAAREAIVHVDDYAAVDPLSGEKETEALTKKAKFNATAFETNMTTLVKDGLPSYLNDPAAGLKVTASEVKSPSTIQDTYINIQVDVKVPVFTILRIINGGSDRWPVSRTVRMRREN